MQDLKLVLIQLNSSIAVLPKNSTADFCLYALGLHWEGLHPNLSPGTQGAAAVPTDNSTLLTPIAGEYIGLA